MTIIFMLMCQNKTNFFCSSLDAAVLAGNLFAFPMICGPTGHAEVRVTLPHRQVTRTLLGVTLSLAATAGKPILTYNQNTEQN